MIYNRNVVFGDISQDHHEYRGYILLQNGMAYIYTKCFKEKTEPAVYPFRTVNFDLCEVEIVYSELVAIVSGKFFIKVYPVKVDELPFLVRYNDNTKERLQKEFGKKENYVLIHFSEVESKSNKDK